LKTVVFAYHNMGLVGLEALKRHGFDIAAVFTHEDDPRENVWFGSVKDWAKREGLETHTPDEVNAMRWIERIAMMNAEAIFSFYYRKMICPEILELPRVGAFNLHGSLLPAYRGRCPVNWVIINGETQTGVTLHYMVEKPDAGDIVGQRAVDIAPTDTAKSLYDKLCGAAAELLDDYLPLIKQETIPRRRQDLEKGSYFGGRRPEDGRIDWKKSAREIYNLIRGVTEPYPGAYALMRDGTKVIIWTAEPVESDESAKVGELILKNKDVLVQTGKDAIRLLDIDVGGQRLKAGQIHDYFSKNTERELK